MQRHLRIVQIKNPNSKLLENNLLEFKSQKLTKHGPSITQNTKNYLASMVQTKTTETTNTHHVSMVHFEAYGININPTQLRQHNPCIHENAHTMHPFTKFRYCKIHPFTKMLNPSIYENAHTMHPCIHENAQTIHTLLDPCIHENAHTRNQIQQKSRRKLEHRKRGHSQRKCPG